MPFNRAFVFGDEDAAREFCQWVCEGKQPGIQLHTGYEQYTWPLGVVDHLSKGISSIANTVSSYTSMLPSFFSSPAESENYTSKTRATDDHETNDIILTHIRPNIGGRKSSFLTNSYNTHPIFFCIYPEDLNDYDGQDKFNQKYKGLIAQIPENYSGSIILILPKIDASRYIDSNKPPIDDAHCCTKNMRFDFENLNDDDLSLRQLVQNALASRKSIAPEHIPYFVTAEHVNNRSWLRNELGNAIKEQEDAPHVEKKKEKRNSSVRSSLKIDADGSPKRESTPNRRTSAKRTSQYQQKPNKRESLSSLSQPKTKADYSHWEIHKHKYLLATSLVLSLGIATIATMFLLTGGSVFGASIPFFHGGLLAQNIKWWMTALITGGTAIVGLLLGPMFVYGSRFCVVGDCCRTWEDDVKIENRLNRNVQKIKEQRKQERELEKEEKPHSTRITPSTHAIRSHTYQR